MRDTSAVGGLALPEEPSLFGRIPGVFWAVLGSTCLLSVVGVVTVHSASAELAIDYLPRQLVWLALGGVALLLGTFVNYRALVRWATPLYLVGLLAITLILLFGHEAGGARSWVGIAGLGGQPSDLAKITTGLFLARYLAGVRQGYLELQHLVVCAVIVGAPMLLIALQPDYGGAVMFLPMFAGMALLAGIRPRLMARMALVGIVLLAGVWTFGTQDYQRDRVISFLSPDRDPLGDGYQVRQSKIAVGSGGVLGKGYMQGTQSQLRFLPARHTDFIFAVLAEERGFVGVGVVLFLYLVYFAGGVKIASRARDREGVLLSSGLLAVLCTYVLYNSAMVIGLVPVTGIPIPFLSYGGSFTLFTFFVTGLILNVERRRYVNR